VLAPISADRVSPPLAAAAAPPR